MTGSEPRPRHVHHYVTGDGDQRWEGPNRKGLLTMVTTYRCDAPGRCRQRVMQVRGRKKKAAPDS